MEAIAGSLVLIVIIFFMAGGADMVQGIFKSKAEAARERRLEAEARVEEARLKSRITLDK